jgi:hypothetical protein
MLLSAATQMKNSWQLGSRVAPGANSNPILASAMSTPQIFLGFDHETFFPGQCVTGVLVVVVKTPVKALQLQLNWYVFVFEAMPPLDCSFSDSQRRLMKI